MTTQLKQSLGLFGLTMIAVGGSVGSGIFRSPGTVAAQLLDSQWILAVWLLGGVVVLAGALTYAELGGLFPKAGGIYQYIREAYGEKTAFVYGWSNLLVINTGGMAGLALTFASYFNVLTPVNERVAAVSVIVVVTLVNIFGVKIGELFSSTLTVLKIIGMVAIIGVGLFFVSKIDPSVPDAVLQRPTKDFSAAFAAALIGVLFTVGGWQHASYLSGEAKNARRNIPLAMIFGAIIITILYVAVNVAYLRLLPMSELAASKAVASDAVSKVFKGGGLWIAVLIAISTFGTLVIYAMSVPRVYFAMASDGIFFKQLAYVHPRFGTPVVAIVVQSVWTIILMLFMSFEQVIAYAVFIDQVFFLLAAFSIFIFRRRLPNAERTVRTWLYPLPPLVFCSISAWFLWKTLTGEQAANQALGGLAVMACGLPFYFYFKRKQMVNG